MRLYGITVGKWIDPWGVPQHVTQIIQVVDVEFAGTFPHDNGYEVRDVRVYVDLGRNSYKQVPPMDYGGETHYIRRPHRSNLTWVSRLPKRCIDRNGDPYPSGGGE